MTVLIFGAAGQVGAILSRHADVRALDRCAADLTDPGACARAVAADDVSAVINAAAYTAVDRAEQDKEVAQVVNSDAPGAMARAAAVRGIPFLQISTDYVFDGSGNAPWREDDTPDPLNVYGRTKLAGERAVAQAGGRWAVLRTSWVFSARGDNFVTTMMRLGQERDRLRIVDDQVGGPTWAGDIAAACIAVIGGLSREKGTSGIFHYAGAPDVTRAEFAREVFRRADLNCAVEPIDTADYPTPAERPLNSRFDTSMFHETFGLERPDWRVALDGVIADIRKSSA